MRPAHQVRLRGGTEERHARARGGDDLAVDVDDEGLGGGVQQLPVPLLDVGPPAGDGLGHGLVAPVVADPRAPARGLRPVHREVGRLHERVGPGGIGVDVQRHADAAPHPHAQVVHLERLPDHGHQPGCELVHRGAVGQRGEDHELVTAEAGDEVLHPQARPDAVRHLAEQRVADVVPVVVVHGLEVVEVDEQAPEHLVAPVGRRDHRLEALLEGGAVGDVGERVVRRRVGEAGRVGDLVGDVVDLGQHVTGLVVLVAHEGHRHLRPEERTVRSVVLGPQVELVATVGRPRLDHRPQLLDRLGAGHLGDVLTDQLVLGGIEQRAQRAVDPDDRAVELDDGHADRRSVEGDARQLVHRVELPFRLQPQGLVPAPDGEVDGARGEHVDAVHGGELEGVGVAALLTEDRVRRQHPDHAVLDQHRARWPPRTAASRRRGRAARGARRSRSATRPSRRSGARTPTPPPSGRSRRPRTGPAR